MQGPQGPHISKTKSTINHSFITKQNTNNMKQMKIFASLVLMMGFGISAMAQSTDNDNILGKATVLQGINVVGVTDLSFGWVSPGLSKTIDLENTATGGQVGEGTQTTGVFSVSAAANSNVQIQFTTLPTNLVSGANNLPIGAYTAGYHTANPYSGGTTFVPGTGTQVAGGNFPTNDIGGVNAIYVFIGGTVTPGGTQASGDYTGTITLTATYN